MAKNKIEEKSLTRNSPQRRTTETVCLSNAWAQNTCDQMHFVLRLIFTFKSVWRLLNRKWRASSMLTTNAFSILDELTSGQSQRWNVRHSWVWFSVDNAQKTFASLCSSDWNQYDILFSVNDNVAVAVSLLCFPLPTSNSKSQSVSSLWALFWAEVRKSIELKRMCVCIPLERWNHKNIKWYKQTECNQYENTAQQRMAQTKTKLELAGEKIEMNLNVETSVDDDDGHKERVNRIRRTESTRKKLERRRREEEKR